MTKKNKKEINVTKLDLGCGKNKREGFSGVDSIAFDGVDVVCDLTVAPWPFADGSVEEVHSSHFIEHLTAPQRIVFANELHRVLKKGGKATLIAPHWCSCRAYGDMTHQWPPVSEFWFYYLSRKWRVEDGNAPHDDIEYNKNGYSCDFDATWGYSLGQHLHTRNQEYQQFALGNYKESAQDIIATLTKR